MTLRCSIAADDFELPTLLGRLDRTETTMRSEALAAFLDGDAERARALTQRHAQVDKLFYLLLRVLFATYRNPDLNRAVGVDTGFPLIGYRSVAQDVVLMADAATDLAALTDEPVPEGAREHLRELADAIDDAADAARNAVVEPSYADVTRAREALDRARERTDAANDYLERERPEPLLRLQRAVCALGGDARHVRDTLDVATRLTFRDGSGATPE
nr:PhoU domain-containing protein [Halarchaeum rubridurum]